MEGLLPSKLQLTLRQTLEGQIQSLFLLIVDSRRVGLSDPPDVGVTGDPSISRTSHPASGD